MIANRSAGNGNCSHLAIDAILGLDQTFFNGRGKRNDFECGPWLVDILQCPVGSRFRPDGCYVVWVKSGYIGERQDFSRVGIKNNRGPGLGTAFLDRGCECLFGPILDRLINRQNYCLPGL